MASAEYSVLTPERVSLQYDIAGVGSRGAAAIVDTTLQAVALVVVVLGLVGAIAVGGRGWRALGDSDSLLVSLILAVVGLSVFAVANGYFIVFEIVWNGQTPGKRLVGLRVIRENGYPLRPVDSVIRNLVRMVDWLPFGYAVGVSTMLLNGRAKRLGDFAAGTIVIREGQRGLGSSLIVSGTTEITRGFALSSSDATLVRDFLLRRASMDAAARADLAQRLAVALAQRYSLTIQATSEDFLESLI